MTFKPRDVDYARVVKSSFDAQALMNTFQAELTILEPGLVRISAPILPLATQQHGAGHAGLTFAIGDSAAGYAALCLLEKGSEVMTVEMKINLLAPARGDRLVATGEVIKSGRRLSVVKAEVVAIDGDHETTIAVMQGTMIAV